MKRMICLALCMMTLLASACAEEYCSISEVCANTPARWTQTYDTKWRTIIIDTAIEVPQVDAFPILKVRKMPTVDESLLPADADVRYNMPGTLQFYTGNAEYGMKSNPCSSPSSTILARNCPRCWRRTALSRRKTRLV